MKVPLFTKPSGAVVSQVSEYSPHGGKTQKPVTTREKSNVTKLPGATAGKSKIRFGVPFRNASELTASLCIHRAVLFVIVSPILPSNLEAHSRRH
jgi:hypothetical protein